MMSMRSLWGLWEVYEAHRQIRSKKTTSQHLNWHVMMLRGDLDHQRICLWGLWAYNRQIRASGGVTGGFGWVQTHPLSKKAPIRFFKNPKNFWGVGGWVERKKAWAVSDCVKQTATSTRCYYSIQLWLLIHCSDHCRFWNPFRVAIYY